MGAVAPAGGWAELAARVAAAPPRAGRPGRVALRAAVLVPVIERRDGLHLLFIRRPETLRAHPGQVAFPGGKLDEGEDSRTGALREAEEELGIAPALVETAGALRDVDTTTGFCMTPWVGRLPDGLALRPAPAEVARVFEAPLRALAEPARLEVRPYEYDGRTFHVPYFSWDGETIWGATGRVVLDLLALVGLVEPARARPRAGGRDA